MQQQQAKAGDSPLQPLKVVNLTNNHRGNCTGPLVAGTKENEAGLENGTKENGDTKHGPASLGGDGEPTANGDNREDKDDPEHVRRKQDEDLSGQEKTTSALLEDDGKAECKLNDIDGIKVLCLNHKFSSDK